MAYTPELSQAESGALRRIAWALEVPMTKTMTIVLNHLGEALDSRKVCEKCRDDTFCSRCIFRRN